MLTLILSAAIVMALSLGLGAAVTAMARRAALARGDAEAAARISFAGTRDQRIRTLLMAGVLSAVAGVALALGAGSGVVGMLVVLSLALTGQAAVLEVVALRRRGVPGPTTPAAG